MCFCFFFFNKKKNIEILIFVNEYICPNADNEYICEAGFCLINENEECPGAIGFARDLLILTEVFFLYFFQFYNECKIF